MKGRGHCQSAGREASMGWQRGAHVFLVTFALVNINASPIIWDEQVRPSYDAKAGGEGMKTAKSPDDINQEGPLPGGHTTTLPTEAAAKQKDSYGAVPKKSGAVPKLRAPLFGIVPTRTASSSSPAALPPAARDALTGLHIDVVNENVAEGSTSDTWGGVFGGYSYSSKPGMYYVKHDGRACSGKNEIEAGVTGSSVDECAALCDSYSSCIAFEFTASSSTCQAGWSCNYDESSTDYSTTDLYILCGPRTVRTAAELKTAIEDHHCADTIVLKPGVYRLTSTLAITREVLLWAEPGSVQLDGNGATRVLSIDAPGKMVRLHGINIANGYGDNGGGVQIQGGNANFNACQIYQNTAHAVSAHQGSGGGVQITGGTVYFAACQIYSNQADSLGGGVAIYGGTANFIACQIYQNTANGGGGVQITGGTVYFADCQVYSNQAGFSGGMHLLVSVKVVKLEMWENYAGDVGKSAGEALSHVSNEDMLEQIAKQVFG